MVISVKGGRNVGITHVRELRGVLDNDGALMVGLILLHDLGDQKARNFRLEMAQAGTLKAESREFARMQMLTTRDPYANGLTPERLPVPGPELDNSRGNAAYAS